MNKLNRSVKVMKAAWAAMLAEKKLLLFPVIAFGLAVAVMLFFLIPMAAYPTGDPFYTPAHWVALVDGGGDHAALAPRAALFSLPAGVHGGRAPYFANRRVLGFFAVVYFCSMFLATFSNVAFYHEIIHALNGQKVSIRRGYRFAATRWQAALLWSLFAGLVGYIIRTIEERVGFLGRIITGLIGMAWSVACIFVLPTLVRNTGTANPLAMLRDSVYTLKRTWGELIIGFVGVDLAFGLIFGAFAIATAVIAAVIVAALIHFGAAGLVTALTIVAAVGCVVLAAMLLAFFSNIVNSIYRCALYIYATEGVIPGAFDQELLDAAWKVKKG